MKSFLNMIVAVIAILVAIVIVGQGIRLYQQNQSEVKKATATVVKYADKAKDTVVDSYKAVAEAAKE